MREKLIELLDEVHRKPLGKEYRERLETIADHLIANGVTVPIRCKDCKKEWCYLRQELGPDGFCSGGKRKP